MKTSTITNPHQGDRVIAARDLHHDPLPRIPAGTLGIVTGPLRGSRLRVMFLTRTPHGTHHIQYPVTPDQIHPA